MALKENYKDDILDVSVNTKRKYRMTENQDGTVSFDDETEYTQQGDSFGASDMNAVGVEVNGISGNLNGFKFYPTGTGIVGLISDDSAYTDEDGNYVIWGTATANQLVEDNPNTYKSVPSTEDCRGKVGADTATPFSKKREIVDFAEVSMWYAQGAYIINRTKLTHTTPKSFTARWGAELRTYTLTFSTNETELKDVLVYYNGAYTNSEVGNLTVTNAELEVISTEIDTFPELGDANRMSKHWKVNLKNITGDVTLNFNNSNTLVNLGYIIHTQ